MAKLTAAEKAARAARAAATAANKRNEQAPTAAAETAAPAVHDHNPAGENTRAVVVVCKLPRGLYLQLHQKVAQDVRVVGGGIEKREVSMRMEDKLRLKPTVLPFGAMPNYEIRDGFSINPGIPADFWRKWLEQNSQLQLVVEGLVAGFDDEASARAYCREYAKKQHGLEPLAQQDDPRVEKSTNANLTDVDIDTDMKTKAA